MSKRRSGLIFKTILTIVVGISLSCHQAKAENITLAADIWCPYNCDPQSDKPGYMVEVAKAAFAKHGITVDYKVMPWARAIEDTKANKYNGVIGAYYRDAPGFVYPDIHQGKCQNAYYVRQDNDWVFKGIESLSDKTLGVVSDYSYSEDLDAYIESNKDNSLKIQKIYGDNATENNLKKLVMGRLDVIVEDIHVTEYYLSQNNLSGMKDKLKKAGIVEDKTDGSGIVFIAFSPNNPNSKKYAKILSDETKIMMENGEFAKILEKYGIKNFGDEK